MPRPRPGQLLMVGWLLLVWIMLWGSLDTATVLFGLLVAVGIVLVFPLPRTSGRLTLRPASLLVLVLFLVYELVSSAIIVGWHALRYGKDATSAIIEVPMLSDVDQVIAVSANVISLAPGEFVLQVDRARGIYYVHALGTRSHQHAQRVRRSLLDLQLKVIKAFAPRDEVRALANHSGQKEGT
ncbi:MAG: Na+/H+ antiporter subunit E [Pseudonocardiaceae bacterium]|nr:Na+/H+ antiporter subunit E [Pseudonocardiaceae bacterium]